MTDLGTSVMKMKRFVVQYASNLFVHRNQSWKQAQKLLTVGKAPNLALLGNIGNPNSEKTKDFVRWCADNWDHVYCVPGPTELSNEERLNGLFKKIPKNISIMDHVEKQANENLILLGAPLWSGYGSEMKKITEWSESERFFMANRSPREIQYWHEEDIEFLVERIRYSTANYGPLQKIILLTHTVPTRHFLPSSVENERSTMLFDGNIGHLLIDNVIGCLSGAGGGSVTGNAGISRAFCGVNAAFTGPSMVPNRQYRPDMTASFDIQPYPFAPAPMPPPSMRLRLSGLFPIPRLAVGYANPVLQ